MSMRRRRRILVCTYIGLLSFGLMLLFLAPPVHVIAENASAPEEGPARGPAYPHEALRDRILGEAALLPDHDWAGAYQSSFGMGTRRLWLAPEAGFLFTLDDCILTFRHHGPVTVRDDMVRLPPFQASGVLSQQLPPTDYHLIRWGGWRYLVPYSEMMEFVHAVNARVDGPGGHLEGNFLAKGHPEPPAGPVTGVPDPFRVYVLDTPVQAAIVSVAETLELDTWTRSTRVTLRTERGGRLLEGMRLYSDTQPRFRADVVAVDGDQVDAMVRHGSRDPEPAPRLRFSTQMPPFPRAGVVERIKSGGHSLLPAREPGGR